MCFPKAGAGYGERMAVEAGEVGRDNKFRNVNQSRCVEDGDGLMLVMVVMITANIYLVFAGFQVLSS